MKLLAVRAAMRLPSRRVEPPGPCALRPRGRWRLALASLLTAAVLVPLRSYHADYAGKNAGTNSAALAAVADRPKLIALTFDDGPKPYVLLGTKSGAGVSSSSLLGLLDRQGVKATFFVMGWRLSKNADDHCRAVDGGVCREAALEEHRHGHEIENHTYGHGDFRQMKRLYGEAWIMADIEKGSEIVQSVTGARPKYLRPPDWDIWPELAQRIESQGYHVMTRSTTVAPALRDVDSEDYFCAGHNRSKCPKPSDYDYVLARIAARERTGVYDHILVFHELPESVELLSKLIPELQGRGYTFVTLEKYAQAIGGSARQ